MSVQAKSAFVAAVVADIEENRRKFEAFCYALSEEQLARPVPGSTWLVRDFIAHLDTLDTALLNWFEAAAHGDVAAPRAGGGGEGGEPFDVDAFNDAQVAARRGWPLDRLFAEARANRERIVAQLAVLTDAQVEQAMLFPGDAKRKAGELPLKVFLQGWAQHDPIHVADMVRALPELADDAAIKAWLDNPFVQGYQAIMNRPGHG